MKVLVFVESRDGKIKSNAREALHAARALNSNTADVAAVIIGSGIQAEASKLKNLGADQVFCADQAELAVYNVLNYTDALMAAIDAFKPAAVLGMASPMGRDLFPRACARADGAIATDVTSLEASGEDLVASKPMYAGKCIAQVKVSGPIKFVSLRPNVFPSDEAGAGAAQATALQVTLSSNGGKLTTKEIRKGASEKADLTEAAMIISGGRAMANADNFKILHECADVIGATVGASRAAVDSGYAPHDMQVGQTGKVVNPNLYIACGISGSIQHMAGMRTSKVIVAVNTDPDAPIFGVADYGIVADLFEAVPAMTGKLKELVSS